MTQKKSRSRIFQFGGLLLAAVLFTGCSSVGTVGGFLRPPSPHARYAASLTDAGLADAALGRAWLQAADAALAAPQPAELPLNEVLYFDPSRPAAVAYRLELLEGQKLSVEVQPESTVPGRLFLDLLEPPETTEEQPKDVASAEDVFVFTFDVRETGAYLLRFQPELLRGGRYTVTARIGASLTFPVASADSRAIGSRFGDPRDGGARSHEGVDIFAPRGTHAVAAADGRVVRVGTNSLGGNIVWMRASDRDLSFYYAHLDRQLVSAGAQVVAGEPVGEVGNTGNARNTPPHLHFGLFANGAIDPYPYLHQPRQTIVPVTADLAGLGQWVRVSGRRLNLRAGPTDKSSVVRELPRHAALEVVAASRDWYRVHLPDGTAGYVAARLTEPARQPVRQLRLASESLLRHRPAPGAAALGSIAAGESVGVLAEFDELTLVEAPSGLAGWLVPVVG